jgi:hypothetical protein
MLLSIADKEERRRKEEHVVWELNINTVCNISSFLIATIFVTLK